MKHIDTDLLFDFPQYRYEIWYDGIHDKVNPDRVIVVKNGMMIRVKDLDCLLHITNLFIPFVYNRTPKQLFDKHYQMCISTPSGVEIYQEEAVVLNGEHIIKVNKCDSNKTKELICRVLFKDNPFPSIKGRDWNYAQANENDEVAT